VLLQEAQARLDGCTALAAAEVEAPVVTIDNLTQEAVHRIARAAGDVEACLAGTGAIMCVLDVVSHNSHVWWVLIESTLLRLVGVGRVNIRTFGGCWSSQHLLVWWVMVESTFAGLVGVGSQHLLVW
jgi:hypothetical protein